MLEQRADTAVVGAGIAGLALALAAARAGHKVVLFERSDPAVGASVRNFGLVWAIGQPAGPLHDLALRSREIWLEIIQAASLHHDPSGALLLAYAQDELAVLTEYLEHLGADCHGRRAVDAKEAASRSPAVVADGLLGGLYSPTEVTVDPREAIRRIPRWLADRHGVELRFSTSVFEVEETRVRTLTEDWRVERTFVCGGQDFESLFPQIFAGSGLVRVKLQMLRTVPQPDGWRLGPALCGGLTMAHYESFRTCPSLPQLQARLAREHPFERQHGIHLLVSQTRHGELTLGDSHQTDATVDPFDLVAIDAAIMKGLRRFARFPAWEIAERWHGIYAKSPGAPWFVREPLPGVTIVNGLGGGGMTLSFALAEALVAGRPPRVPSPP